MNTTLDIEMIRSGLMVFGLENCEPCELLDEILDDIFFKKIEIKKVVFDPSSKDHRALIRSLRITGFPAIFGISENIEIKRLYGINVTDTKEKIIQYIETELLDFLKI